MAATTSAIFTERPSIVLIFISSLLNWIINLDDLNAVFASEDVEYRNKCNSDDKYGTSPQDQSMYLVAFNLLCFLMYALSLSYIDYLIFYSYGSFAGCCLLSTVVSIIPFRTSLMSSSYTQINRNIGTRIVLSMIEIASVIWLIISILRTDSVNSSVINIYTKDITVDMKVLSVGVISAVLSIHCNVIWIGGYKYIGLLASKLFCDSSNSDVSADNTLSYTLDTRINTSVIFLWLSSLFKSGYERKLTIDDLPMISSACTSRYTYNKLDGACSYGSSGSSSSSSSGSSSSGKVEDDWCIYNKNIKDDNWSRIKILIKIGFKLHGVTFIYLLILKVLMCMASFVGPLLLGQLVNYIDGGYKTGSIYDGILLVICISISFILTSVLNTLYSLHGSIMAVKIKGSLTRMLFSRSLSLPLYAYDNIDADVSTAKLINLVQIDVDKVADTVKTFHDLWMLPVQIVIAFILLYMQVKVGFVAGVVVIVIMIPINTCIASKINVATGELMVNKDKRIQVLTELVRHIRPVKMQCLERDIGQLSQKYRQLEMNALAARKYLDAVCVFLWASTPVIVPFATFTVCVLMNDNITSAQMFTSLALLNMLIYPMNAFPWIVNGFVESRVSALRIVNILLSRDRKRLCSSSSRSNGDGNGSGGDGGGGGGGGGDGCSHNDDAVKFASIDSHLVVEMNDCTYGYTCSDITATTASPTGNEYVFSLKSIKLKADRGHITCIVGPVACGKTSLVLSILQEVEMKSGKYQHYSYGYSYDSRRSVISYCPQTPYLHAGTVKYNITLGHEVIDRLRLDSVIAGLALDADVLQWPHGLNADVGNGGCTISGGQRLRIGIARALYTKSTCVVIDDPFSALDDNTSQHVMEYLHTVAVSESRAIIITTHSLHLLTNVSTIYVLNNGTIVDAGSHSYLLGRNAYFNEVVTTSSNTNIDSSSNSRATAATTGIAAAAAVDDDGDDGKLERGLVGRINSKVYLSYMDAVGYVMCICIVISTLLMQLSANAVAYWYSYWCAHVDSYTSHEFIQISGTLVLLNIVFALFRSFLFARGGLIAAVNMFNNLMLSLLSTDVSFFEQVSLGKIVNRLGKDTYTIDDSLPFIINIVLAQVFMLLGSFTVIAITDPILIVVLLFVSIAYYRLQTYYRYTSRELKRLDAIHRSPLYSLISDSISNGVTIRSMKCVQYFEDRIHECLDNVYRVNLALTCTSLWLGIRLQLLGCIVASSIALSAIISVNFGGVRLSPSLLGLSMVYSLSIVNNLNGLVGSLAETEQEFVSVERVREYICTLKNEFEEEDVAAYCSGGYSSGFNSRNQSSNTVVSSYNIQSDYDDYDDEERQALMSPLLATISNSAFINVFKLNAGSIKITNMYMKYHSSSSNSNSRKSEYVLKGISMTIAPGSKVLIAGRTGSGKSSFFNVLLRMNSYEGDICIDGIQLRNIPKRIIRNGVSMIPQDPFLISGTIRLNLDPTDIYTTVQLEDCIRRSGFIDTILQSLSSSTSSTSSTSSSMSAGSILDYELKESGYNLSQGQRQLLCLSRALLRQSKLILCDETMANVDSITQNHFINILKQPDMKETTVLLISHKIDDNLKSLCDRVIVFDQGTISDQTFN